MDGPAPSTELIQAHVPCLQCGYDLYASSRSGNCPECGRDVAPSVAMASVLHDPANASAAKSMAGSLLASSIFAGLCPGACLLLLATRNAVGAVAMTVAFAVCAFFAAKGERHRRAIRDMPPRRSPIGSPLVPDIVAAIGLALVNLAGYLMPITQAMPYETREQGEVVSAAAVGFGFFLLCATAWRAVPTWRAHAEFAWLLRAPKLEKLLLALGWIKAIYETAWLATCWTPFVLIAVDGGDAAVGIAFAALFGLIGFAVVWVLMIVGHAILLTQIRRTTFAIRPYD